VRRCNLDSGEVCADDVVAVPMSYERARRTSVNPELQAGRIYEYPPVGEAFEAGPLAPRAQFGQVWSGSEMLIWGGSAPYRSAPLFADGAAFDPAANRWRMLAAAPLGPRNNPLAVWTGREMIVFGSESKEVASYDPARDRWRSIPDLDWVPEPGSSAVFAGGQVVLWSPVIDRAAGLDPTTETWTALEGTGVDVVQGRLLASPVDGVVYAIGRGEYPSCNGLVMARLDSRGSWHHLAAAEMGTTDFADCGSARYSAVVGSRVHVFGGGGRESRFRAYVAEEERWLDLPSPPLHGCESWPGPSVLGSRLLVNGGCDHQAIYDPTSNNWKEVAVPNEVRFNEWLWTGTEALTWGSSTNPAVAIGWRFTP
ncbi:MAG: hypothetical protein ACT4OP_11150, partial [Actinomycetota bacterium]